MKCSEAHAALYLEKLTAKKRRQKDYQNLQNQMTF